MQSYNHNTVTVSGFLHYKLSPVAPEQSERMAFRRGYITIKVKLFAHICLLEQMTSLVEGRSNNDITGGVKDSLYEARYSTQINDWY